MQDGQFSEDQVQIIKAVMKKQATLSLRVGAVFILLILGVPLFNLFYPKIANTNVFGFTLAWLFLGVLFFPITWALSAYFVKQSDQIEADASQLAKKERPL